MAKILINSVRGTVPLTLFTIDMPMSARAGTKTLREMLEQGQANRGDSILSPSSFTFLTLQAGN
ncbi:MAG: hypothetical protein M1609_15135 [Firmicutes bacterium]|nr:hypothetical protein [Bacillota bacterium]